MAVPNVTPMIDVMLVLLIIFMVVTPSIVDGVRAEPPEAEHFAPHPPEDGDHTLAIDARGEFYLDRTNVPAARLGAALASLYPAGSTSRVLYVKAHKDLSYAHVVDAMEVARKSGVAVVGLVSEQKLSPQTP